MKNVDFIKIEEEHSLTRYSKSDKVFQKGQGAWLWDVESQQYFDLACLEHHAIFGHSPTRLVNVLLEQAKTLSLNTQNFLADRLGPFLKKLTAMSGFQRAAACSSLYQAYSDMLNYAETNARLSKALDYNLATSLYISSSQNTLLKSSSLSSRIEFLNIEDACKLDMLNPNITVVIVDIFDLNEPGLLVAQGLLTHLQHLCQRNRSLLVADLGKLPFAMLGVTFALDVYPRGIFDGVILGEYLGAGLTPLAALGITETIYTQTGPLTTSLSSLYPLGAAVGLEALCMVEELFLTEQALRQGTILKNTLESKPHIEHIYQRGNVLKLNFSDHDMMQEYLQRFSKEHLIIQIASDTALLLSPPLICTEQELDLLVKSLNKVFSQEETSIVLD